MRPKEISPELTARLLRDYTYDPLTGDISRRMTGHRLKPIRRCLHYRYSFRVDGRLTHIFAHRLAWLLHYGRWPNGLLDHIDGDTSNNRVENLRECDYRENNANTLHPWRPNPETGLPGVNATSRYGIFRTCIHGKHVSSPDAFCLFCLAALLGRRYNIDTLKTHKTSKAL